MSHPLRNASGSADAGRFLEALDRLRWLAASGQALTLVVIWSWLELALPWAMLAAGVAALLAFNLVRRLAAVGRFLARAPVAALAFDIAVLAWQFYWSGGPANPFVSLFVVPIALAAVALPARSVLAVAMLAVAAYSLLWWQHRPLPHVHGEYDLHLLGMWINFVLTAAVVAAFGVRIAGTLGAQRAALAAARERTLRDEGLLALASTAAGAAHALNTPLSTLAVLVSDLRESAAAASPGIDEDLVLMQRQVDACRDAVRQLVARAGPGGDTTVGALGARVESIVAQWRLLRPAFALDLDWQDALQEAPIRADRSFDYIVLNLLDNAADASHAAGCDDVALRITREGNRLVLAVGDRGAGFAQAPAPFRSDKPQGLGVGLALAAQVCERFGGTLSFEPRNPGTWVRAELDLAMLQPAP